MEDLAIKNAERMLKKLSSLKAVKEERLESIKRLMLAEGTDWEEFRKLNEVKYELKREIRKLHDDVDYWASDLEHHKDVDASLDMLVGAVQYRDDLQGLTRKELLVKVLKKELGWK